MSKDVELTMLNASRRSSREMCSSKKLTRDILNYLPVFDSRSHLELRYAIAQSSRESSLPIVSRGLESKAFEFGTWW
jgi:hypothetical protein